MLMIHMILKCKELIKSPMNQSKNRSIRYKKF